ncbi:hypothetical protein LRS05_06250 [Flavobacterium sp. J372]|uniref:YncE family protein n=1 Tax=Flavobacterium sp. J372 TaxID=2898436 RepID=UPI002150AE28|nr:DUF5074 domain-containing protein [Flavobacterium sp. J372]MCR5861762.1 hypothetical protein [Flavobacterium sp. J372]
MKFGKLLFSIFTLSAITVSCSDDDVINAPSGAYADGLFVLNQGNFNQGNASVSFISNDFTIENNVFAGVNPGMILGDTAQDMAFNGDLAYIVLNNSHKIEIVNRYTFKHVATIDEGLDNPRYIEFSSGKAFVTNWGSGGVTTDDFIAVINLENNTVTSKIPVPEGPESMVQDNGKLYIAHKGGYGFGNTITVLNPATNTILSTINVGDVPEAMEIENGKLYVINGGIPSWMGAAQTTGSLMVINLLDNSVASTMTFTTMAHPKNLQVENGTIYYTEAGKVFKMNAGSASLPVTPLFTVSGVGEYGIDGFAVKGDHIYAGNGGSFTAAGKVYVYSIAGNMQHEFTAGIGPVGFYFN